MAEKRKAPDAPDAARKRKAPTIDLTATDVTPKQAAPAPPSEPPPAAARPPETPPPPPQEPPRSEPEAAPSSPPPPPDAPRSPPIAAMFTSGAAGGVIVAAVAAGLWYGGLVPSRAPVRTDMVAKQQMVRLQEQVDALTNRPSPAADTKAVDALAQRVAQLEATLKNLPKDSTADPQLAQKLTELQSALTPLTQRLSSAETAIKSGDTAVAALGKRIDDIAGNASQARQEADTAGRAVTQLESKLQDLARNQASTVTRADIEGLQQKLTALEAAEKTARASAAQSAAATSATRLALATQALRNAVVSGAPYGAELAQAKALGADPAKLAPLESLAATGVPGAAALSRQLRDLLPQMQKIAAPRAQASGSFLERLQANASNLVRISPADAPTGDAPADVMARLEVEAARNDIAAAAADIGKLPDAARAPAKDWIGRVKARQAALAAADDLAASAARALSPVAR